MNDRITLMSQVYDLVVMRVMCRASCRFSRGIKDQQMISG